MIEYTQELADRICDLLIEGNSMVKICERKEMPSRSTLLRWLQSNPDFEAKCARAREMQADLMDDLILDVAKACDEDNYQSSKVKLSAYQWRASKLAPKKYGEKLQQEITGELAIRTVLVPQKELAQRERPALEPSFDE